MEKKKVAQGCLMAVIILISLSIGISSCGGKEETFHFTIDEFEKTFKEIIDETKGNSFIDVKNKKVIETGRFSINLVDGIDVLVDVDRDNKVKNASVIVASSSFLVYNKEVRIAFQALLKSMDSSLSVTQQLMIFENLGITGKADMLDHEDIYSLNDITYSYKGSVEADAIRLSAEPE